MSTEFKLSRLFALTGVLVLLLSGLPAYAKSKEPVETGKILTRNYDFKEAGKSVDYALYVPTSYKNRATPLVVLLHGLGSNPAQVMAYDGIASEAEKHGFIVVAPFGYNTSGWYGALGWGKDFKVGRVPPDSPNNLGELSEKDVLNVLALIEKEFKIDKKRVYLMGHSMGGGGSLYLGMKYPDKWAALAALAPAIYSSPDELSKIRDLPIIVVQGDKDTLVPVENTRKWIAKMDELKMNHKYIEIPGGNHFQTIFNNPKMIAEVFDFLSKQKK